MSLQQLIDVWSENQRPKDKKLMENNAILEIMFKEELIPIAIIWYEELDTYVCEFIEDANVLPYQSLILCVPENDYIDLRNHIRNRLLVFVTRGLEVASPEELEFHCSTAKYGQNNQLQ